MCVDIKAIDSIYKIQLLIRQHGAVVSRINVNNPELFRAFFEDNPTGVLNDTSTCSDWPSCGQPFGHAILVRWCVGSWCAAAAAGLGLIIDLRLWHWETAVVQLVGYNNTADPPYWIAQSTWAEDFADGGRFRVAYGIAGAACCSHQPRVHAQR